MCFRTCCWLQRRLAPKSLGTDGQSWPLVCGSRNSLPLTNRPHCKAAQASADVKSSILPGGLFSQSVRTRILRQIATGLAPQMSLPSLSLLSVTRSWGSFQRFAQSSIQNLPLTDAHLAADGWGKRERPPGVSPHRPGKAWEFLADLPASTQAEKQIRRLPMVSFSLGNWVNATLCVRPSMHKSQEIQERHSHSPRRPFTHR